jgi:hypothetical protein
MAIVTADKIKDNDGFTTQHCKSCERFFKVDFTGGSKDPIAHCPYCNYQGQFWTIDQMHYLDCWARLKGPCTKPGENGPTNILATKCKGPGVHNEKVKHDGGNPPVTKCIICGNGV